MPIIPIDSLDDPRLEPYRFLKDRDLAASGQRFIAESTQLVRRLLQSKYPVESILIARRRLEMIAPITPPEIPLLVIDDELMRQTIGFKFHSGVLGCGVRLPSPNLSNALREIPSRATALVLPDINNTENLGAILRIAAGFGVNCVLLGPHACDPFYRQSIRVSMGAVFQLCLVRSENLADDLQMMRDEFDYELFATVLDASAENLRGVTPPARSALLLGNESEGLSNEVIALCDRKITIPMQLGTDSLNVAIAAAVVLYEMTR